MENIITEEQQEVANKSIFKAAFDALSTGESEEENGVIYIQPKIIAYSIAEAQKAKRKIENDYSKIVDRGSHATVWGDVVSIVASAFWCVSNKVDYECDMAPMSSMGKTYYDFAKAVCASKLATIAIDFVDDDEAFSYSYPGAALISSFVDTE